MKNDLNPKMEKTPKVEFKEEHIPWAKSIREVIFGMNDGLVSTLSFLAGVSGAVMESRIILIAAFAEMFAGAASMFSGEYLSVKSQREYFESEIEREKKEVETVPELEREELRDIYRKKGFNKEEVEMIVRRLTSNKKLWVKSMMEDELKLFPEKFDKPLKNATLIGISFLVGSIVPVIPFIFFTAWHALMYSVAASVVVLFVFGIAKARITNKNGLKSGLELTLFAMAASVICYFIGKLFSYFLM
ncbi:MAG: VIT family protein [Candidatus Scalindua rubra]|uniref:VIT family protein n=1 Tax=Candidatus Scalindua rubra TaxID=1872076 RepID=A0A1E3XCD7_9BACT|nr:MAG: VIT family protein [Candidatus Scalindua rubra]